MILCAFHHGYVAGCVTCEIADGYARQNAASQRPPTSQREGSVTPAQPCPCVSLPQCHSHCPCANPWVLGNQPTARCKMCDGSGTMPSPTPAQAPEPPDMCGHAMIGGFPCTRAPDHGGEHARLTAVLVHDGDCPTCASPPVPPPVEPAPQPTRPELCAECQRGWKCLHSFTCVERWALYGNGHNAGHAASTAELARLRAAYTETLAERDAMQSVATQAGRVLAAARARVDIAESKLVSQRKYARARLEQARSDYDKNLDAERERHAEEVRGLRARVATLSVELRNALDERDAARAELEAERAGPVSALTKLEDERERHAAENAAAMSTAIGLREERDTARAELDAERERVRELCAAVDSADVDSKRYVDHLPGGIMWNRVLAARAALAKGGG